MDLETKTQILSFKSDKVAGLKWGSGSQDAQTVVLLHGWLDSANSFLPLASLPQMNDSPLRWLAIDFAGHGLSEWRTADAHYYFIEYVYDVLDFLEREKISRCHFVGHSMGALVAGVIAAGFGDKVITLTQIDGFGLITSEASQTQKMLQLAYLQRQTLLYKTPRRFRDYQDIIAARLAVSDLSETLCDVLMRRSVAQDSKGWSLTSDPRLKSASAFRYTLAQAKNVLTGITAPTLALTAENGLKLMEQSLAEFKSCYSRLSIVPVKGGHHCHMEYPSITFEHISQHISANNRCEL
ncbi:alpha/beta fold hydrolase [Pseudoalteromonas fenneropenaei]|uniref:Alpha/beta fold hydrolase n=1 Tax=Pseudoalteromonas fenneropenaei TaxID=1737459 RepID=A0ABV7CIT8_9GAMM